MKTINIFLGLLFVSMLFSCNNEWEDEQYEQYISFKAPINERGCTPAYVRYKNNGKSSYQLPIIVSGSTMNGKNIDVHVAEDKDTLRTLNEERFGIARQDIWYKPLEKGRFYNIPETVQIKENSCSGLLNIDFNLKGLDMKDKWVIPLTIVDDPSYNYTKNPRKNYAKAILRIWPFNDYSGRYSTSTMEVYFRDPSTGNKIGTPMVADRRTAYVVDENTVYFYAGLMNEEMDEREKYKIYFRFHKADDPANNKIEVWAEDEEIKFNLKSLNPTFSTIAIPDVTRPYLEHRYVSFAIEYDFNDISTTKKQDPVNPSQEIPVPILYKVKGRLVLERNVNTQIPDEDQAIEW